ncbi:formylglycine-generating enzyme family protein [Mastigocladus laminosus UU774]|nr:formylglycine-generating enzyme family protein [Mastigocladus laminosus UU774]
MSPNFISKPWPKSELEGLVQKEINFGKVILPIWHNVSYQKVFDFSPIIAGKLASNTSKGLDKVVDDIIAALRKAGVNSNYINKPKENPSLKLQTDNFKTVKLSVERDSSGKSIIKSNFYNNQANYFVEDLGFGVKLEMVEIPGGTFLMGAYENEKESNDSERPVHHVTVPTFFMGKYTITQEQWDRVVNSCPQVNRELKPKPSRFKGNDRLPVECVSWYDAVEFCARLSQKTSRNYRLPSEAEWEYACRAGTTTPFYFGDTITDEVANYDATCIYGNGSKGNYRGQTTPVGIFPPNYFGLYDMHGNLWEWCLDDWHHNYEGAPTNGTPWFDNNDDLFQKQGYAVLRGGSWINNLKGCRSAYRYHYFGRGIHFNFIGFRVVCAAGRSLQ